MLEVCCSRKIAAGFQGISDSRAKVGMGFGMLAGSREIVCRCVEIYISRRTDHHGSFYFMIFSLSVRVYIL